jgi:hypothetical protein
VIAPKDLLADMQKELRLTERDLLTIAETDAEVDALLRKRYDAALTRSRTGLAFEAWRGQQLTQAAAGWLLACVYTRFCEDNRLLEHPMLAGPGERLAESREWQADYFRNHPTQSDLDYLRAAVGRLTEFSASCALADKRNPMHLVAISPDRATGLLSFWRKIDPATGALVHDFTDEKLGTRFLGDLYQDLSEQARKDYALLQTPDFIEEFILDRTLDPAIDEYGLAQVKLLDPACGSGHFLLGAFARLLDRWREQEPGTNVRALVERVLAQVHGVDINPYAGAIARFRMIVAALTACGITRLADAPTWKIHVATGDSLRFIVHVGQGELEGVFHSAVTGMTGEGEFVYEYEDAAELHEIFGQRYHAVVANPPYITVKDPALNSLYRELWWACSGKYALSVPFAQRLYDLAVPGGFTGQITSNSFMKREFGKKLIEEFFFRQDLSLVIDTSGAYIPGHGTPTVIICGRNRRPVTQTVRAVLGIRGEPGTPEVPAKGLVWTSIIELVDTPGAQSDYVSVTDLERAVLARYPWSLSGGGANELVGLILEAGTRHVSDLLAMRAGFASFPGADDVFVHPRHWAARHGLKAPMVRDIVTGDVVRDWGEQLGRIALVPYDTNQRPISLDRNSRWVRYLWPFKTITENVVGFGGLTRRDDKAPWWTWYRWVAAKYQTPLALTWAEVATHNHFVLDRGGKVFKHSAPVLKLPEGATEQDHLRLLGLLNSSTACFLLKQVSHNKGSTVDTKGARQTTVAWENFYAFNSSKLEQFPLPTGAPLGLATRLDKLATDLQRARPSAVAAVGVPTRALLDATRAEWERIRSEMISAQEELDWEVYGLYGLLDDDADNLTGDDIAKPPLRLGERAFEIALARQVAAGEAQTAWFNRHRSTPITDLPSHWPSQYRALVQRRLAKIADDLYLRLIEQPECKRRWASPPWEEMEADALADWLLDRLESRALWFRPGPAMRSVAQLADALRTDSEFVSVAGVYARDADLADVISALVRDQHAPFVAPLRYTESGMRARAEWERTWDLQRREDLGEKVGTIPVPLKYKQGDFRDQAYWRNRGKLDVPNERFISYPGGSRDGTLLLGWAGWDYLEQAQALTAYITERRELDAWDTERLKPLLAGLAELLPWVKQWHPDVDPEFGVRPGDAYDGFLGEQCLQLGLIRADLAAWRPEPSARGRRRAGARA